MGKPNPADTEPYPTTSPEVADATRAGLRQAAPALRLALEIMVKSVGWACTTYTLMQILGGQLSGGPLLNLVAGGLVYGAGLFAFHLYSRSPGSHSP